MNKNVICDNIKGEGQKCIKAKDLYSIKIKSVSFKLGCYKFKILIIIAKLTIKEISVRHTEKKGD